MRKRDYIYYRIGVRLYALKLYTRGSKPYKFTEHQRYLNWASKGLHLFKTLIIYFSL